MRILFPLSNLHVCVVLCILRLYVARTVFQWNRVDYGHDSILSSNIGLESS